MKKRIKRDKEIKISLTQEEMERIERIAKKVGKTKSHLARNLVLIALEDAELFEKFGLFEIAKLIEKIRKKALGSKELILKKEWKNNGGNVTS